jgi:hypothetical protein
LVKYYEGKGFTWPDRHPFADIYIIAFEPPQAAVDTNRARSFEATSRLAETLVQQPPFKALIRRVVYLQASVAPEGFVFEPRFRFE